MDRYARRLAVVALAVAVAALAVAIFDGDGDSGDSGDAMVTDDTAAGAPAPSDTRPPDVVTTPATIRTVTATTAPSTVATVPTPTTSSAPQPDTTAAETLPGVASDDFGPAAGAVLSVVGIGYDSDLNLRDIPAGEIIDTLLPLSTGIIATGRTRQLPTTIWHEVRIGEIVGWASSNYLAPLGGTRDITADIAAMLDGDAAAETMTDLGRRIAGLVASDEPASRIRVSVAPVVGDVGEITMDVVGLPDDAVRGFRLHIVADVGAESESFSLRSVGSTVMCHSHRGVNAEGRCH